MKPTLPDLRLDGGQITLDHCYVLLERLGQSFSQLEDEPGLYTDLADDISPELVRDCLEEYFKAPEFHRLFKTEMGKGVLVGIFIKSLWDDADHNSAGDDE